MMRESKAFKGALMKPLPRAMRGWTYMSAFTTSPTSTSASDQSPGAFMARHALQAVEGLNGRDLAWWVIKQMNDHAVLRSDPHSCTFMWPSDDGSIEYTQSYSTGRGSLGWALECAVKAASDGKNFPAARMTALMVNYLQALVVLDNSGSPRGDDMAASPAARANLHVYTLAMFRAYYKLIVQERLGAWSAASQRFGMGLAGSKRKFYESQAYTAEQYQAEIEYIYQDFDHYFLPEESAGILMTTLARQTWLDDAFIGHFNGITNSLTPDARCRRLGLAAFFAEQYNKLVGTYPSLTMSPNAVGVVSILRDKTKCAETHSNAGYFERSRVLDYLVSKERINYVTGA